VPWNDDLIFDFSDQIDWSGLASNPSVYWTSDTIIEALNKGCIDCLSENPTVWHFFKDLKLPSLFYQ
jgi:hypothetical protein